MFHGRDCRGRWIVLLMAGLAVLAGGQVQVVAPGAARITVVLSGDDAPYREAAQAAQTKLEQLGYAVYSIRLADFAQGTHDPNTNDDRAFVAIGTPAAVWLHQKIQPPTPSIYCMVAQPQAAGLMEAPSSPGISTDVPLEDQVKLMGEALPKLHRVGMLYRSDTDKSAAVMKALQAALPGDWRLEAVAVDRCSSAADAIELLLSKDVDIVWTAPDSSVYDVATVRSLLLAGLRRKTPVFGFSTAFVKAGALVGTGISAKTQGEQVAALTDQLLRQRAATSQPAARPTTQRITNLPPKFEVAVNLVVAEQLGLSIPDGLVRRADVVIRPEKSDK